MLEIENKITHEERCGHELKLKHSHQPLKIALTIKICYGCALNVLYHTSFDAS